MGRNGWGVKPNFQVELVSVERPLKASEQGCLMTSVIWEINLTAGGDLLSRESDWGTC